MKLRLAKGLLTALLAVFTLNTAVADDSIQLSSGTGTKQVQESINIGTGEYIGVKNGDQLLNDNFVSGVYTESLLLRKDTKKYAWIVPYYEYEYQDLTIEGKGQVVVAGRYDSSTYAGITANKITVNGDDTVNNLIASSLLVNDLEVKKGNVELHTNLNSGGQFTGGNGFVGYMPVTSADSYASDVLGGEATKQVVIKNELKVSGGTLTIGVTNGQGITTDKNGNKQHHYQSSFGSKITQENGSVTVNDMSLVSGDISITQHAGTMSLSAESDSDTRKRLTFNSNGTATITQYGEKANTIMALGKLCAYNKDGNPTENVVNVIQEGNGTLNMLYGAEFSSQKGEMSSIEQKKAGNINLGGSFENVSYNITQRGDGGKITLQNGAVMNANEVEQTANATLTVESGAKLTAESITVKGELANNGSITVNGKLENNGTITGQITLKGNGNSKIANTFSVRATDTGIVSGKLENSGTINGEVILDGGTLVVADDNSVIESISATEKGGKIEVNGSVDLTETMELNNAVELVFSSKDSAINMKENAELNLNGAQIAVTLTDADLENLSEVKLFTSADEEDANWGSYEVTVRNSSTGKESTATLNYNANGDVTLEAVPEPTTATLSLLALAALASRRRRK